MTLWFVLALMTAAAIGTVLWPLGRTGSGPGGSDTEVYLDQLDEIKRDRSAGLIGEAEAEAAKVEVSRRLIAAADAAEKSGTDVPRAGPRRWTAVVGLSLLPAGAVALYLAIGSPEMPGAPLVGRTSAVAENRSVEALIAQVEAHVERNPDDGRGWEVLAPVYMRLGRFDDAVTAWRNTIRLSGSNASREANYGEAVVATANGAVTAEARAAFERALALDRQDVMARFFMGMAADQDGRRADADAIWGDLLAHAPPDAPWVDVVRQAMARGTQSAGMPAPTGPASGPTAAPGPSAADVNAAAAMSEKDRIAMISGMVSRLADRLKENGNDIDGWQRLLRAYMVLGERHKAQAAAGNARRALASDPDKLRQIDETIKSLGLEG
jgi:cytochrome c-type biogenesis protein CcmH